MAAAFLLRLDLERIRTRLAWSSAVGKVTDADVEKWLADCGLVRNGEQWFADEVSLDALDPDEILSSVPIN